MNKIEEQALKLKDIAKSLLNENTPKQDADKIASLNEGLDEVIKENGKVTKEYDDLKNDYIGLIKNSGSKERKEDPEDDEDKDPINNDEDFNEALEKFASKNKK